MGIAKVLGDPIYTYSRAQALEDGVLVDVSKTAREAGVKFPTAVTSQVWADYVTPDPRSVKYGQSVNGRLWDLLFMFSMTARRTNGACLFFKVAFIMKERQRRVVRFKALCGPGDDMEPVVTIMLPEED